MADNPMLKRVVDVLLGLQMLSEGGTLRWDKERTSSSSSDQIPVRFTKSGALREHDWSPYEYHRWKITGSRTTDELEQHVIDAEKALRTAKTGAEPANPEVPHRPAELRLYVLINCRPMRATEVASLTGMSVSWVRGLREKNNQPPNGSVGAQDAP